MALNAVETRQGARNSQTQVTEGGIEGSRRPEDRRVYQQTYPAWSPYLTPWKTGLSYLFIALTFILLGIFLGRASENVVEYRYQYDGAGADGSECSIVTYREGKQCNITFEVEEDMSGPVYVYYELTEFYQNHATYVDSVYTDQLLGSTDTSGISACEPLEYNGSLYLNPCGLIANTLFNDVIELSSGGVMEETGIAWTSDIDDKYDQPDGFVSTDCEDEDCQTCLADAGLTDVDGETDFPGCGIWTDAETSVTYAYYYPDEDEFQYLYETFPEVINPIEGVTNEHFIVWMRVSGSADFRKLYGIIEDGVSAGTTLEFGVTANFIVDYYDGTKSLVISTTNRMGARNAYWGQSFTSLGACIGVLAVLVWTGDYWHPRPMGDIKKLLDG